MSGKVSGISDILPLFSIRDRIGKRLCLQKLGILGVSKDHNTGSIGNALWLKHGIEHSSAPEHSSEACAM